MPDSSGFTEDQLADFQECFLLFDTKGDTRIPVKQVGDVLRALGQNPTESDVKKLVQSSGQGKADGRVTFEQFLPMLQAVSSKQITDTVDDFVEGLRHFDKEGNGRRTLRVTSTTRSSCGWCWPSRPAAHHNREWARCPAPHGAPVMTSAPGRIAGPVAQCVDTDRTI